MSTNALATQGLVLSRLDTVVSPQVYTTISEVFDIQGPTSQAPEIDVTDFASTAKEFILGLVDDGEITFQCFFRPALAIHSQLRQDLNAASLQTFRLTFTDSPQTDWTFNARVSGLQIAATRDDAVRGTITLRLTGGITQS